MDNTYFCVGIHWIFFLYCFLFFIFFNFILFFVLVALLFLLYTRITCKSVPMVCSFFCSAAYLRILTACWNATVVAAFVIVIQDTWLGSPIRQTTIYKTNKINTVQGRAKVWRSQKLITTAYYGNLFINSNINRIIK